jgi:hypothetical protein
MDELGLCRDVDGELRSIKSLVCESSSTLIEASNPGLKIPACGNEPDEPKVLPEHLPVSAVFVTCRPDNEESCTNIATEILKKNTGATVNILINQDMFTSSLGEKLKKLKSSAVSSGAPLNIIPIAVPVGVYMRDPGVVARSKDGLTLIANPHLNQGFLGEPVLAEVAAACGYKFERTAAGFAKFDAAYEMLVNPKYRAGLVGVPEKLRRVKTAPNYQDTGGEIYGGNFMALPGGSLIVGEMPGNASPSPEILSHFEKRQKVLKIQLPQLPVGHVDEVYRIIPTKDACGFAVIYASPAEMVKFLKTRPKDELVRQSDDLFGLPPYKRNPELAAKLVALEKQVRELQEQKKEIPEKVKNDFKKTNEQFAEMAFVNLTTNDILSDQKRMKKWAAEEELIKGQLERILAEIAAGAPKGCKPWVNEFAPRGSVFQPRWISASFGTHF